MKDYLKAVVHALALLIHRRTEAMEIIAREPMRLMRITNIAELERQVDGIVKMLCVKAYPTVEAILNSNAIAADEYGAEVKNPLVLWDLHWLKEIDDEGFIDELVERLSNGSQRSR